MFDRLTTLPHGLRVFVERLLYGLQHILMPPARDAPLHAGGAALLERTVATHICPIASQLLPVLFVRIVVLQLFASRTAIRILVAEIDKVLSSASINQLSRLLSSLSPSLGQLLQINVCITRPLPWGGADVVNQLLRSLISIWDYVTPICFRHTLRECTLVHADSD